MPVIELKAMQLVAEFAVAQVPLFTFTDSRAKQIKFRPKRLTVTWQFDQLTTVVVTGNVMRDDNTEIGWQQAHYDFTADNAPAMPQWVADVLTEHGWAF